MPTLHILGKIEPEWLKLDFNVTPTVGYQIGEVNIRCLIDIKGSNIDITCEVSEWTEDLLPQIVGYTFDWVSAEVNIFSFASGKIFEIYLNRAIYPDGKRVNLNNEAPKLAALATACTVKNELGKTHVEILEFLPIVIGNPPLMLALHDLISALRFGQNPLTNCARAVEGMRNALWGRDETDEKDRNLSWEHFRANLRLSKDYLKKITDASRGSRHGSAAYIPVDLVNDVRQRTWIVMNRILIFRKNGNQPLPEKDFPIL